MLRILLSLGLGLIVVTSVRAQANAKVPDPDPELERKTFIVPEGFEVSLYAADPLLAKPIQMNFDPQGRLWVATSELYPQIKPGQKADDKIIILEDTNGDGKADKTTVFADGLLIPTGIEPGDGGAYVANSTELVHLSASKPGGKADRSRVVLSGFGTEDTHHIIHTFRWGPDGCLYFNQSIYIHSHIETPRGVKRLNAGGIWRFRPESMDLDVLVRGFVNSWGHHHDRWGQSLITDGAYGEGVNHGVPGAHFVTAVGSAKLLKGLNPGSPKHCGLEIASGRHLPDDWQGNVITNDFRGHRVCRFKISDDGSSFTSREMTEVIKSNHPAFRPIDVKMGPDGAIYIADWYNPIIQHGEVDFRDPRRDHVHGRIWRVSAKGRPLVKKPDLVGAPTADLLDRLKDPEEWTRRNAKRVLKERGAAAVIPELDNWVKKLDPKQADYEHHLVEALWTYQSLLTPRPALLETVLNGVDYHARSAAVRVLVEWRDQIQNSSALMAKAARDESPRVRMEAVRALAELKTPEAAEAAMAVLDRPTDRTLEYAAYLTARDLESVWLPAFRAGRLDFDGNVKHLTFALEAVGSKDAAKPILDLLTGGKLPKDREGPLWVLLARIGGPKEIEEVLEHGLDAVNTPAHVSAVLAALEETARQRKVAPASLEADVIDELQLAARGPNPEARRSAMRLIGLWKIEAYRRVLEQAVNDPAMTKDDRRAAVEGLALLGEDASVRFLTKLSADADPTMKLHGVVGLIPLSPAKAADSAVGYLSAKGGDDGTEEIISAFLRQKGGGAVLAKALSGKKLPADIAKVGLRTVRASVQDAKPLVDALTAAGGLQAVRTEYTPAEVKAYVEEVLSKGNAVRGEQIYRRKDATCLACHAIAGAGGLVGPDMTSIGASAQVDYLVESLLMPNKAVKEGYHALKIVTKSEKVISGIKTREAGGVIYLRTAEDKEIAVAEKDVDEKTQTRSLMPDGLADQLTRDEFVDLVRFLSELGKVGGPYAPNKARLVRRWQNFDNTTANMNQVRRGRAAVASESPEQFTWSSTYSMAAGDLPLDALNRLVVWRDAEPIAIVRAQLDVTTPGKVRLRINDTEGLSLAIAGSAVDLKSEVDVPVAAGTQYLTFVVDLNKRKNPLRIELDDTPGSPAKAAIVGGK